MSMYAHLQIYMHSSSSACRFCFKSFVTAPIASLNLCISLMGPSFVRISSTTSLSFGPPYLSEGCCKKSSTIWACRRRSKSCCRYMALIMSMTPTLLLNLVSSSLSAVELLCSPTFSALGGFGILGRLLLWELFMFKPAWFKERNLKVFGRVAHAAVIAS